MVLHYSAGNLERPLGLSGSPDRQVSSHLIISENGEIIEVVRCWDGIAHRTWHAGESLWFDSEREWEGFSDFSVGIEMVNLNVNIIPYPKRQHAALADILAHLRSPYPARCSPERVLGHEQIAGWRGKADPGWMFDWGLFFELCYPNQETPSRDYVCPRLLKESLQRFLAVIPDDTDASISFWHALSIATETAIRLLHETRTAGLTD